MAKNRMLSYIDTDSPVHSLSGAVKLIIFLFWSVLIMVSYETPLLILLAFIGIVLFKVSKIRFSDVSFIFKLMGVFLSLNLIAVYVFSPEQGVIIYASRDVILEGIGRFTLTKQQLFYEFNIFLKYINIIPPAVILLVTTHPSEFASSLNRIGIPYTVSYAVSLTLRYIPDVQRDFESISQAQQARGLELSEKAGLFKRIKRTVPLLLPLIIFSLARIDIITRAMELRGFGKNKKRTWYAYKPINKTDIILLVISIIFFTAGIYFTFYDGNRFYNPWACR